MEKITEMIVRFVTKLHTVTSGNPKHSVSKSTCQIPVFTLISIHLYFGNGCDQNLYGHIKCPEVLRSTLSPT